MGEIGKLRPHPNHEPKIAEWSIPVAVFDTKTGDKFKVISIYEDEGYLCIDIEVIKDD